MVDSLCLLFIQKAKQSPDATASDEKCQIPSHRKQLTEHFKFLSQAADIGSQLTTTLPLPIKTDSIGNTESAC